MTASYIKKPGLRVFSMVSGDLRLLGAAQRQVQLVHDLRGDLVLDPQDVREEAVESIAPNYRDAFDINQLHLDIQPVAPLRDFSHKHHPHAQLSSKFSRVELLSFVVEDAATRHDAQLPQAR